MLGVVGVPGYLLEIFGGNGMDPLNPARASVRAWQRVDGNPTTHSRRGSCACSCQDYVGFGMDTSGVQKLKTWLCSHQLRRPGRIFRDGVGGCTASVATDRGASTARACIWICLRGRDDVLPTQEIFTRRWSSRSPGGVPIIVFDRWRGGSCRRPCTATLILCQRAGLRSCQVAGSAGVVQEVRGE